MRLVILGYSEAAMFLRGRAVDSVAGIISIHGSREFAVEADVPNRLDLAFDDVEVPNVNDALEMERARCRRRSADQNGLIETPPTRADAGAIIRFANCVSGTDGTVLCHCGRG